MNLGQYIANVITEQGRTKTWVADKAEINYKTFVDKITRDSFTGKELLRIAVILNIDLEKLKGSVFKMKKNVFNGENTAITVVTDFETVVISAQASKEITMDEDARFNAPDGSFYVEENGEWYAKDNYCESGADIEIYNAGE